MMELWATSSRLSLFHHGRLSSKLLREENKSVTVSRLFTIVPRANSMKKEKTREAAKSLPADGLHGDFESCFIQPDGGCSIRRSSRSMYRISGETGIEIIIPNVREALAHGTFGIFKRISTIFGEIYATEF